MFRNKFIIVAVKLNVKLFKEFHVKVAFFMCIIRDTVLFIGTYSCRLFRMCIAYADCRLLCFMCLTCS